MSDDNDITRLIIKVTRDTLPQIKDKYPFLYLERGRLEIDDSSVKWIDSEANFIRLPIATINTLLLGPGTSITHEAIKIWQRQIAVSAGWVKIRCYFMRQGFHPRRTHEIFENKCKLLVMRKNHSMWQSECLQGVFQNLT